jgi:predicted DNA-binding protein
MKENDADLVIRIPGDLKERARAEASEHGRTLSNFIRWLIERALDKKKEGETA